MSLRHTAFSLLNSFLPFQPPSSVKSSAMAEEDSRYDLIVFGATGFTGAFVVEEMGRVAMRRRDLRWAVAGRNEKKLRATLDAASEMTGIPELQKIPIIIADTSNQDSLVKMAEQGKVVLNCVGPYRFFGEPVVKACVEAGAHHLDVSGEPQYLESMQLRYGEAAAKKGVYIVGACGWDSIPAEMGVCYTEDQFSGDLNAVQCFINFIYGPEGSRGNFGTWQSAIHGFAHRGELPAIRKQLFAARLPKPQHRAPLRRAVSFAREVGAWCVPFPGSDRTVVQRTQRFRYNEDGGRPIQFQQYLQMPTFLYAIGMILFGIVFAIMASFRLTRALLERFPRFFSAGLFAHGGPTRSQIAATSFTMTFIGEGWDKKADVQKGPPKKRVMTCVSGPEPGYIATPICLIQAGLTVLQEREKMPGSGGVITPGYAFAKTKFIQRLQENRIVFMVIRS